MPFWGPFRRDFATIALALLALGSSSCLARRRVITRNGGSVDQKLIVADKDTLLDRIAVRFRAIQSFAATVDMVPALGSADKGKITELKDVRAYIYLRKPNHIRLIGLYPFVRTKAFDMVSTGPDFRLYLPSKNRFIIGPNQVDKPSPNKIANLRPFHFLEALMVRPVDPSREAAMLENFTDEDNAAYIVHIIEKHPSGEVELKRDVWFERVGLRMVRQKIFDAKGNILTDARYDQWQTYDGVFFPKHIEINRPQDEYAVVITLVKMEVNKALPEDRFALAQPEGTELQVLGRGPEKAFGSSASESTAQGR
jgi:outer membrane lipoprotein-sorting protein